MSEGAVPETNIGCWDSWRRKLVKNHLVLGFGVALLLGLCFPWLGETVGSWKILGYRVIPTINLVVIFIISGICLKTKDVVSALKAPTGFMFGMFSILVLTPLVGFAMREIPFSTPEFSTGLAVVCAVPTSLSLGVALVQAVRLELCSLRQSKSLRSKQILEISSGLSRMPY